ncbi:MAG: hypothetical protein IJ125_03620 [Atopobiaceae bacterium]|nr:hypothetical protein [Atopobiaceae bacterium]
MGRIVELIERLCPDGVEYKALGEIGEFYGGSSFQKKRFLRLRRNPTRLTVAAYAAATGDMPVMSIKALSRPFGNETGSVELNQAPNPHRRLPEIFHSARGKSSFELPEIVYSPSAQSLDVLSWSHFRMLSWASDPKSCDRYLFAAFVRNVTNFGSDE